MNIIKQNNIEFIKKYVIPCYKIDVTEGIVYSCRNPNKIMKSSVINNHAYITITINKNKSKLVPIHWIIAVSANIIKENQYIVHIDGNNLNNKINNLQSIELFSYKIINNDLVEIYIQNFNQPVLIDKDDLEIVKDKNWRIDKDGYVVTNYHLENHNYKTSIKMHRLLTKCPKDKDVDHINHIRHDNRKDNLRICKRKYNTYNRNKSKSFDGSKYSGVYFDKAKNKWCGRLMINGVTHFKRFKTEEEALIYRLNLEYIYFKEFSPQIDLFEKYNIGKAKQSSII